MRHEIMDSNQEKEQDIIPGFQEFIKAVSEPVESIPGENVRRTAGNFSLRNQSGGLIDINFATSTHEKEPNGNIASETEVNFLRDHLLKEQTDVNILLVEQGSPLVTQNHMDKIFRKIAEKNPWLADEFTKQQARRLDLRKHKPYTSEIHILPEDFAQEGKYSLNIDLARNPLAYRYIFEDKGLEETVRYTCREVQGKIFNWKEATPVLVSEVLKSALDIDPTAIQQAEKIAQAYIDSATEPWDLFDSQYVETNAYRDMFMARQIQKLEQSRYKFLCHTTHLVGILHNLKDVLKSVSLSRSEVAINKLNILKNIAKRRQKKNA